MNDEQKPYENYDLIQLGRAQWAKLTTLEDLADFMDDVSAAGYTNELPKGRWEQLASELYHENLGNDYLENTLDFCQAILRKIINDENNKQKD